LSKDKSGELLRVLITASGVGSRLGDYTKFTNKSLVQLGDRPALARIIDSYPVDAEFVITLGYHGELVRQFLNIAYPARKFDFVPVEPFEGLGSSLAFSMLCARELLQSPFIYHACDTLVPPGDTLLPDENWLGGFSAGEASLYASFDVVGDNVVKIHPKGMDKFDYLYVGLAGIHSYESFWRALSDLHSSEPQSPELNDLSAITTLISGGEDFTVKPLNWWRDVGSIAGLQFARNEFNVTLPTLEKRDEAIFYFDNRVFKFFADQEVCSARVQRAAILAPNVPPITASTKNWYSYCFVEGEALSQNVTPRVFGELLDWAQKSFWTKAPADIEETKFYETCKSFYFEKSKRRIEMLVARSGFEDTLTEINGELVPSALSLIQQLEGAKLITGKPGIMHGDFILDNILKTEAGFLAIDWRQGFGDLLTYGDVYYDLAKLNHSLTMNHSLLMDGHFEVSVTRGSTWVDILRKTSLIECEKVLAEFVVSRGYDMRQIKLLTSLIWINMAPLHQHGMDLFLFQYGRYSLWRTLVEYGHKFD